MCGAIRAGMEVGWNEQLSAVKHLHQRGLQESGESRKGEDEVIPFINVFSHSQSVPYRYLSSADGSAYWWRHGPSLKNAGSGWAPCRHRVCFLFFESPTHSHFSKLGHACQVLVLLSQLCFCLRAKPSFHSSNQTKEYKVTEQEAEPTSDR